MLNQYFIIILFTSFLYAHPHTFIDVYPTAHIDKNGYVKNIRIKWLMDEMTSSMLIMEFDENGNGKIDKNENNYVRNNYFLSLKEYNYYMNIKYKYKVSDFQAKIKGNKIEYDFSIIFNKKIKIKNLSISFYDTDFFVAMQLKDKFVTQKIPHKVEDIDGDFYYGYKIIYK